MGHGSDHTSPEVMVVVAASGSWLGGLQVDRLGELIEVMLKPPLGLLSGIPGIAGTAMLGDGSVLLVLSLLDVLL